MRYYFDTSAFIKLIIDETQSEEISQLFHEAETKVSSRLLVLEVESTLQRLSREKTIDTATLLKAQSNAKDLINGFHLLSIDSVVLQSQMLLQQGYSIKTLDSLHLASAEMLKVPLVTYDRQMRTVAKLMGLKIKPLDLL